MSNNNILHANANMTYLLACTTILLLKRKKLKKRRWWIRPINKKKYLQGDYYNLINEMRLQDTEMFFVYTRMTVSCFDNLLAMIGPRIKKKSNRPNISEGCRLAVTLRMLASGDSLQSVAFAFRMGKSTVCDIYKETCQALWDILQPIYMEFPNSSMWESIAKGFENKWQLYNCTGAVDGKHIVIKSPNNSGSLYFNYKKQFSTVLFAVCDAEYQFTYVNIGSYGSQSDGGVLRESSFGNLLNTGGLNLPADKPLPGTDKPVPHFFVGDAAFPLQTNFLRPYGGKYLSEDCRIFNYRLSRARRCIENTFGILAARWRIFHKIIYSCPENVDHIVKATVCLHNYIKKFEECTLRKEQRHYFSDRFVDQENEKGEYQPGEWRDLIPETGALRSVAGLQRRLGARNAKLNAVAFRDYVKEYVCGIGQVPWQLQQVRQTI